MKDLDVITIGRAGVDLYGAQIGGRLEDMGSFDKYIGGSPTNIACGTARLGLKTALISRVGDEHMGRFILEQRAREGVCTDGVKTDPERLTALVILGIRNQERFPLIFYRENCADMALCEDDIDEAFIRRARAVVVTGTHLSHPRTEAAVFKALNLARKHGLRTGLDIDYRPNLWGVAGHGDGESRFVASQGVTDKLLANLHHFDLIVGTEEEFHIAGGSTDTIAALRAVRDHSKATLVCKRGVLGAVAFEGVVPDSLDDGQSGEGFPIEVFNVLGAGDGFFSGLLKGRMEDADWSVALKYANACGAFAVSRHGCTPAYPSLAELEFFLKRGVTRPDLRNDPELEQIHCATTRHTRVSGDRSEMRVFAFDHRLQLEEMPGYTPEKGSEFKELCLEAALQVQDGQAGYGILCDNRIGRTALHRATGAGLWIGRPTEWPGSRPLMLEPEVGPDCGQLVEWARENIIKVLCFCHPDDDAAARVQQEETVKRLFAAGRRNNLEFLLEAFPTWRGQNEKTMAHAAIAYAKASKRTRAMAVTSSIGTAATNLVTAAALAHVNRLPILLIPGDVFANRRPDPVLQQVEDFEDGTVSANDCLRPVSRYFDRISRPEHLLTALPRALATMTDPASCGPVTLAFCQDTQAEAYDYPVEFFEPRVWRIRRPQPDTREIEDVVALIRAARNPVIVAGGGVIYSQAEDTLARFAEAHNIPVVETQAGKSALAQSHPLNFGASGVDGSAAANAVSAKADLVIGVGTRFQDFTTGSWALFKNPGRRLVSINVAAYDAVKHGALPVMGDAKVALDALTAALGPHRAEAVDAAAGMGWLDAVTDHCRDRKRPEHERPSDAEVIGAVQRATGEDAIAMCAAGTMPGALKLLWQPSQGGYHMEYGFSCMGYEIGGAVGIKLARPEREVICFVGDGSYMMANSELATAVMRRVPFTAILTDNRGYGCINRLQQGSGGEEFNNLYKDCNVVAQPEIDYVAHAASMGAHAVKVRSIADLETRIAEARGRDVPAVIVIDTDATEGPGFREAGHGWDVAVPEIGQSDKLARAYAQYLVNKQRQRLVN